VNSFVVELLCRLAALVEGRTLRAYCHYSYHICRRSAVRQTTRSEFLKERLQFMLPVLSFVTALLATSKLKRAAHIACSQTQQYTKRAHNRMKILSAILCLSASSIALAACPNQCSGHGMLLFVPSRLLLHRAFSQATAPKMMHVFAIKPEDRNQGKSLPILGQIAAKVRISAL